MNVSKVMVPCARLATSGSNVGCLQVSRRWFASSRDQIHPGYTKIKEKYAKFQIDNGVPVHLKGGMMDYVLYYATLLGCGIGLGMCGHYYYTAAFPKKS